MQNHFSVWSEFTSYQDLIPILPELKAAGVSLNLAIHEKNYKETALYELLKAAEDLKVEVRAWPLLDKSKGYWPNKWNLRDFRDYCLNFFEECKRNGVEVPWVIMDMEPHIELLLELEELLKGRSYFKARRLILEWGNRKDPEISKREMQKLIAELHGLGKKVQVVAMPMVLDDKKMKLQHNLGIPVMGLPWDEVSFMVYRPYFWDYVPGMTAEVVRCYGQDAVRAFGEKTSLALGPIGSPMVTKSQNFYRDPQGIHEDIAAANMAGIRSFSLFSLEGIREQGKLSEFTSTNGQFRARASLKVKLLRKAVKFGCEWFL